MKLPEVVSMTETKFFCLFVPCEKVDCPNRGYIVTTFKGTLEEAKKEFPTVNFCVYWEAKEEKK